MKWEWFHSSALPHLLDFFLTKKWRCYIILINNNSKEEIEHGLLKNLLKKNKKFREKNTYYVDSYQDFAEKIKKWFVMAHRDGSSESADKIQEEFKATIRCVPNKEFLTKHNKGKCIVSGKESKWRVLFAKSY